MLAKNPFRHLTGGVVVTDEKMSKHTSLGVGGPAKYFSTPTSFNVFKEVTDIAKFNNIPIKVIGNGTNLLVSDNGFNGLIVSMKKFNGIRVLSGGRVSAYSGENLKTLILLLAKKGLTGLEELSGIPATVGGAVFQNAGAFNKSISDSLESVKIFDGRIKTLSKEECEFSYRESKFKKTGGIILSATFNLKSADEESINKKLAVYNSIRKSKQPTGKTCGSVFINSGEISAGSLIEQAGLKGFSVGGATISNKHANFIINKGSSAEDVYLLIEYAKRKVYKTLGVKLKEEVEIVGEF